VSSLFSAHFFVLLWQKGRERGTTKVYLLFGHEFNFNEINLSTFAAGLSLYPAPSWVLQGRGIVRNKIPNGKELLAFKN